MRTSRHDVIAMTSPSHRHSSHKAQIPLCRLHRYFPGEVGVTEFGLKETSRVCRRRHGEVAIVEFGHNTAENDVTRRHAAEAVAEGAHAHVGRRDSLSDRRDRAPARMQRVI